MTYVAAEDRYDSMPYRRLGTSGLKLPAISLGLWHNFGDDKPLQTQRDILRRAFDRGVTHFDLANNYGPPYGSAETNFGRIFAEDFARYRGELIISSKAGWDMWPGPYGFGGSRKYLVASCDDSLKRMGLDYVDIFYHHRPDPDTPVEETMQALDFIVRSGRALYAGISSYSAALTAKAQEIARDLGTPLVIHQPSYSILNRWVQDGEPSLLQSAADNGMGVIAFSPLAQGMLTDRYLDGIPADSRAAAGKSLNEEWLSEGNLAHLRALNDVARGRGQSLAQMAIAWVLRDQGQASVTSALLGASSVRQLDDNLGALDNLTFSDHELAEIDAHVSVDDINIWQRATDSVQA
ncbi:L-glyceraldehyde 3-phosphate reductase [Tessaracoccus lubricantis]|uniref:L-glyceraldehyde 3-phosphate reductase n=1 Tax=Tessaracoccus lubricantis TaxID=545543 RepID=A0ABP9EZU7_9ACTN